MQILLTHWRRDAQPDSPQDYAAHLLSRFDGVTQAADTTQVKSSLAGDIPATETLPEPLSPRELEVLALIALGKTNQEIAQQLVVARGTIKAHAASIYRKLDVTNRTEAVARARDLGVLS